MDEVRRVRTNCSRISYIVVVPFLFRMIIPTGSNKLIAGIPIKSVISSSSVGGKKRRVPPADFVGCCENERAFPRAGGLVGIVHQPVKNISGSIPTRVAHL